MKFAPFYKTKRFAKFTIQKSEKRIVCSGKGYQISKPGLSNNP